MNEKLLMLAIKQIRDELINFLFANSFTIEDPSNCPARTEVVSAADFQYKIDKLFEGITNEEKQKIL